jgi:hypothetical protein
MPRKPPTPHWDYQVADTESNRASTWWAAQVGRPVSLVDRGADGLLDVVVLQADGSTWPVWGVDKARLTPVRLSWRKRLWRLIFG